MTKSVNTIQKYLHTAVLMCCTMFVLFCSVQISFSQVAKPSYSPLTCTFMKFDMMVEEGQVAVQHALMPFSDAKILNGGDYLRVYKNQPLAQKQYDKGQVLQKMLRMMAERGIPVVLGSDAHRANRVGEHFITALNNLTEAGYEKVSYFQKRQRIDLKISDVLSSIKRAADANL